MRKLKLDVDELTVETFGPAETTEPRGTVVGLATRIGETCGYACNYEYTWTCYCQNTGYEVSCPNPQGICGTVPAYGCEATAYCTGGGAYC
ncbi:MAG TPA: hypothetical protein VM759_00290 [Longimicrobium sp.]|nr:hypothetical protein [Longimicrobium sp.]